MIRSVVLGRTIAGAFVVCGLAVVTFATLADRAPQTPRPLDRTPDQSAAIRAGVGVPSPAGTTPADPHPPPDQSGLFDSSPADQVANHASSAPADRGTEAGPAEIVEAVRIQAETGNIGPLRIALLEAARRDPAGAMATLGTLDLSDRLKIDIGAEMLGLWTDAAPREAAAWAQQNRWPGAWGGPVGKVAEDWSRRDPAAALDWAAGLSPGLDQTSAIVAAVSRWSRTDFSAVAGYVGSRPRGPARDVMVGTLAREFGQEDPAAGLRWALAVDDPAGRERAAAGALADVYASDTARAALLLQGTGLPGGFREAVMNRLAGPGPWWR